jgi:hypothetical protein
MLLVGAAVDCPTCEPPSWVFAPSTFTHDPATGARVAQYERTPPIEPLDDPRLVTSRYRRIRTNIRGADGSVDSQYEVQSWGNGRGGIDAEWERFHNAWQNSYLSGSGYNTSGYGPSGYGPSGYGPGYYGGAPGGYPQPYPAYGYPAYGSGPPPAYGYGRPPVGPYRDGRDRDDLRDRERRD